MGKLTAAAFQPLEKNPHYPVQMKNPKNNLDKRGNVTIVRGRQMGLDSFTEPTKTSKYNGGIAVTQRSEKTKRLIPTISLKVLPVNPNHGKPNV